MNTAIALLLLLPHHVFMKTAEAGESDKKLLFFHSLCTIHQREIAVDDFLILFLPVKSQKTTRERHDKDCQLTLHAANTDTSGFLISYLNSEVEPNSGCRSLPRQQRLEFSSPFDSDHLKCAKTFTKFYHSPVNIRLNKGDGQHLWVSHGISSITVTAVRRQCAGKLNWTPCPSPTVTAIGIVGLAAADQSAALTSSSAPTFCIHSRLLCDGINHCGAGEDESAAFCACGGGFQTTVDGKPAQSDQSKDGGSVTGLLQELDDQSSFYIIKDQQPKLGSHKLPHRGPVYVTAFFLLLGAVSCCGCSGTLWLYWKQRRSKNHFLEYYNRLRAADATNRKKASSGTMISWGNGSTYWTADNRLKRSMSYL